MRVTITDGLYNLIVMRTYMLKDPKYTSFGTFEYLIAIRTCAKKDRIPWLRRAFSASPEAPCDRAGLQDVQEMYAFPKRSEEQSAWSGG